MKPVDKGVSSKTYSSYGKAKPDLLEKLGEHCSYCERQGDPQDLHVEHIYPKDPHPEMEKEWDNFLISCNTCNTYKHHYQGNARQVDLESKFIWPHLDNTFSAFVYKDTGEVCLAPTVPAAALPTVEATREMVGLLRSPAVADTYQKLGIAYDGANKRSQAWGIAKGFRDMYASDTSYQNACVVADGAAKMGYFSVWMEVFKDYCEVRKELIRAFKADQSCFDPQTEPVTKGRL